MRLTSQPISCPEALFKPRLIEKYIGGVHHAVHDSVEDCDTELRKELLGNIVISGGTTQFPGFGERLIREVLALAPAGIKVKVAAAHGKKDYTWVGGSLLTSLDSFQDQWVLRDEFNEAGGDSILFRKCL